MTRMRSRLGAGEVLGMGCMLGVKGRDDASFISIFCSWSHVVMACLVLDGVRCLFSKHF